jgi:DNA-binding PucR family transcriptional regulator
LLAGQITDSREARERAQLIGLNPQLVYRVLLVALEGLAAATGQPGDDTPAALGLRRHVLQSLLDVVATQTSRAIGVIRQGELIVLVPTSDDARDPQPPQAIARLLLRQIERLFPSVHATVGIGSVCAGAPELARSFAQARQAVQTARLFREQGSIVDFDELGIYRLLFETANPSSLRAYVDEVLGPLVDYDRRHEADLLRTLRAYFVHNGSLQAAARELFVHVNTVAYRMQRIEQISGRNLADADDRLAAQLALKILDGLGPA